MDPNSRRHCRPLLLLLPTLSRSQPPSQSLSLRLSLVTIMVQTLWNPSRSRAQRENQSRNPTVGAAPSSAPSSRWRLLSSLPSPFKFLTAQTSPPPINPPSAPHLPCHSPSSNFSRSSSSPSMSSQVHPLTS